MTVMNIIKKYLQDNGFFGLAGDECGCDINDLFSCGCDDCGSCEPAYCCEGKCDSFDWDEFDYVYCAVNPKTCKERE